MWKVWSKKTAKQLTDIVNGIWGFGKKTGILYAQVRWNRINDDERIMKKAIDLGERLVQDIQSDKSYWYKDIASKIISRLFMRPIMKKNILANKNSEMKGIYENLKLRGLIES